MVNVYRPVWERLHWSLRERAEFRPQAVRVQPSSDPAASRAPPSGFVDPRVNCRYGVGKIWGLDLSKLLVVFKSIKSTGSYFPLKNVPWSARKIGCPIICKKKSGKTIQPTSSSGNGTPMKPLPLALSDSSWVFETKNYNVHRKKQPRKNYLVRKIVWVKRRSSKRMDSLESMGIVVSKRFVYLCEH